MENFQIMNVYTKPFTWSENCPAILSKYSPDFLSWFVGFAEGDGCFSINVTNNSVAFSIGQKDLRLLLYIQEQLGFGFIVSEKDRPDIKSFRVVKKDDLAVLIEIFNGNFLLKKTTSRFADFLNFYNNKYYEDISLISRWSDITYDPKDINLTKTREFLSEEECQKWRELSVVWNTSWFLGFIEAEGCFSLTLKKNRAVQQRFVLDQTGEVEIIVHVRHLLDDAGSISVSFRHAKKTSTIIKKTTRKIKRTSGITDKEKKPNYQYCVTKWSSLLLLQEYLKTSRFHSLKNNSFQIWSQLLDLYFEKKDNLLTGVSPLINQGNSTLIIGGDIDSKINFLCQELKKANARKSENTIDTNEIVLTRKFPPVSVKVYTSLNDFVGEFQSLTKAANFCGVDKKTIKKYLDTGIPLFPQKRNNDHGYLLYTSDIL
jgi:hypothetical protein